MKLAKTALAFAVGLGMAGAAYADEPYQNAAQTELKRQTSEARLVNHAAAKICKGADPEVEIDKASKKASQNNAKANAKVDTICGGEARAATCRGLYTDAPGGGEAEYPLDEEVNLAAAIEAQVTATCVAPIL